MSTQIGKKLNLASLYQHLGSIYYSAEPYQGVTNNIVFMGAYKPSEKLHLDLTFRYSDFKDVGIDEQVYDYSILRGKITYQMNKYFFIRAIAEYNSFREHLLTDFLASFTWVPGTVVYFGYGSIYEKIRWEENRYIEDDRLLETTRGFFFKCSYLHRF